MGYNNYGQLGIGTSGAGPGVSSPTAIGALTTWVTGSMGNWTALAIKGDGTLWSWGRNNEGQLGHNDTTDISSPAQVGALTDWSSVCTGYSAVVALKTDGTLWSWGDDLVYNRH